MNSTELLDLAAKLVFEHGLAGRVKIKITRARTKLGSFNPRTQTICLSALFAEHSAESITRDTILHEIAHAIVKLRYGSQRGDAHGWRWKQVAREVGANPNRLAPPEASAGPMPVEGVCSGCNLVVDHRSRLPRENTRYRHRQCGGEIQYRSAK